MFDLNIRDEMESMVKKVILAEKANRLMLLSGSRL